MRRTVILLSVATTILFGFLKWVAEQILGNAVSNYLTGQIPDPAWKNAMSMLTDNVIPLAVALAIVLGVYALGRWDRSSSSTTGPTSGSGQPPTKASGPAFAHALHVEGVTLDINTLPGKRKRTVQIGVSLKNLGKEIMRYQVDQMFVSLNHQVLPEAKFLNRGGILHPGHVEPFKYPPFLGVMLPNEAHAEVQVYISYGPADGEPVRHLHKGFDCTLRAYAKPGTVAWLISDDTDEAI